MLRIQKPKIHDNTDGDLIIINKSKLSYHLQLIKEFFISAGTSLGWLGIAVAFILPAFITDDYIPVGKLSGDTIRALIMMLGIIFLGLFLYSGIKWLNLRKKNDPDVLVANLLRENPLELKGILWEVKKEKE